MRQHRQLQSTTVDQLQQSYHRNLLYRHLLNACRFARQWVLLRYIYANRKLLRLWHRTHKKECPFESTNWVWPVLLTNSSNFYWSKKSQKVRSNEHSKIDSYRHDRRHKPRIYKYQFSESQISDNRHDPFDSNPSPTVCNLDAHFDSKRDIVQHLNCYQKEKYLFSYLGP